MKKDFKDYFKYKQMFKETDIDIGIEMLVARIDADMTQGEVAKRMKTKQPSISRVERGAFTPSFRFLQRFAKVVGCSLLLTFVPKDKKGISTSSHGTSTTYNSFSF